MEDDESNPLSALEPVGDHKLSTGTGIGAVALTLAMKYHDINTVQEGALYQQYKLEGKNMVGLHIDMVFETAMKIEAHLLGSSDRIAALVMDAIRPLVDDEPASDEALADDDRAAVPREAPEGT